MSGWIKLHRKIKDHWLYKEKRTFSRYEAWLDLLMMVNHNDKKTVLGSELVEVKRGQRITSVRQLCEAWGWSNTKVKKFLELLQNDGMIHVKSDSKKTVITIDKYELYQGQDDEETTEKRHANDAEATQKRTNKNDKNLKNDKNDKENYSCEFETFWTSYPRKVGKKECYKTWQKLLKNGETPELIITCAENYAKQCIRLQTEERFIKHPKTFLNEERYKDFEKEGMSIGFSNVEPFRPRQISFAPNHARNSAQGKQHEKIAVGGNARIDTKSGNDIFVRR